MSHWTEERTAEAKRLWAAGFSASLIARQLGNVSRNAVIGKLHRIGCVKETNVPRKTAPRVKSAFKPPIPIAEPVTPQIDPIRGPVKLIDMRPGDCRFPIGDPRKPDFRYCAAQQEFASPYCAYHRGKMYSASADTREARRKSREAARASGLLRSIG